MLPEFGCTQVQGYLFIAPRPAAEARRWFGARLETATGVA
jgi:EAL domain-containing protein (putative c-di-GMP-specific phosphodiesterase class I)